MENSQPKKKNAGLTALIALLLIITTVASCVGLYAWAKYISSQNGQAIAQIAKWYFNLKTGEETIDGKTKTLLELTRTDEYGHVAQGKIAPGTHGELPIIIDTTGTEVDLQYSLVVVIENCPTNMVFTTSDAEKTTVERSGTGTAQDPKIATITVTKYISHSVTDANRKHNETITWNWPYETLDANNSAVAGDEVDKADNGKEITVRVSATGTEMLNDPNASVNPSETPGTAAYAATHASTSGMARWQSVNYTPETASISNDTLSVAGASLIGNTKVASIDGASLDGTISTDDAGDWVILDFDETTGEVKIIPRTYSSTTLQLSGMEGYNNAITALDTVAGIYKNDTYASSSRSLTVEDVNAVEGYDPAEVASGSASASASASGNGTITHSWDHRYGMDANLNIVDYGEENVEERTYVRIPETGYYSYETSNFNANWGTGNCWLASRCVDLYSYSCSFSVRYLGGGYVDGSTLFGVDSGGDTDDGDISYPVVPVVTLKSTVKMDKDNNGVWQLSL